MSDKSSIQKKTIVVTISEDEYKAFKENCKKDGKTGQFVAYRALEKIGAFKKPKDASK